MNGRYFNTRKLTCHYWDGRTDYRVGSALILRKPGRTRRMRIRELKILGSG